MKITWKIFFCTVLTMTVTFCIAGYLLISAFFSSSYEQSVNSSIDLSRMFLRAFGNYMINVSEGEEIQEAVAVIASDMLKENAGIYIEDGEGKAVYSDTVFVAGLDIRQGKENAEVYYRLLHEKGRYYIRINNRIQVGDTLYLAVTWHDVTKLFTDRASQVKIYNQFLIYLVLANGVISFILARFIVRPIRKMSRGAGRIADGDLEYRLSIRNQDEIGALASGFNKMADSLAGKICELEDVAERQEEFIGSFAHELKTPLTSIIGYADLIRSGRQEEEERFLCANYIFQEGKRLETLSLRLLELTVIGKEELKLRSVYVAGLFEEVKGIVQPVIGQEEMELICEACEGQIVAEPDLMKSVLMNLIDNARKSMKPGGKIWLTGRSGEKEGEYVIIVKDSGRGIPAQELDRIIDAFYMVDKSRGRSKGGAGLGLSICHKIIELHGGRMEFESEPGQGTIVRLTLPVCRAERVHLQQKEEPVCEEDGEL